jgi:hypothetical protein
VITESNMDRWLPYVNRARAELMTKTIGEIQRDTAYTWAARALVAYDRGWKDDAIEYGHEAAEHAALAELAGYPGIADEILSALKAAHAAVRTER